MSDSRTPNGCKTDEAPATARRTSSDEASAEERSLGEAPEVPGLLAQIPDVGAPGPGSEAEAGSGSRDGRILSPGLSAKILLGGGLFLLLVAVMPFVFGRKDDPEHSSTDEGGRLKLDSPAPLALLAPKLEGKTAQTLKQEAVEAARSRSDNYPTENVRGQIPPLNGQPQVAIQTGPVQTPPSEQGPRSIRPPGQYAGRPVPGEVSPPPGRYPSTQNPWPYDAPGREAPIETNRPMALRDRAMPPVRYDANGVRRDYQAANRHTAIGNHPNADPRYRQPGYQRGDANGYRRDPRTGYPQNYADNDRRPYAGDARAYDRRDYDRAEPSPRVADRRQAVRPRYPTNSASAVKEPGVARFKGVIEKPTVRTSHDGAGSSIY